MTIISGKKPALIVLIFASIFSAGIALWCTSSGIGVNPDSLAFLGVADNIIAGDGVTTVAYHLTPRIAAGQPLTVFPPTYPLLLSLSGRLSADRLNGARWLNALLFAASVFLVGMIAYLCTGGSVLAMLVSVLLFQFSPHMLDIYAMAWSEPPFICFVLFAVLFLAMHISKPNYLTLICAALSAGLALTTRYVGVTILPPMMLTILLLEDKQLRSRIKDSLILAGIGMFPLAAWLVRNMLLADSTTSRSLGFHPIGVSNIKRIINTQLLFWVPIPFNIYFKTALLVLGGSLTLSAVVLTLRHNIRRERRGHINSAVQMFSAAFVATYLIFILAYNSFVSPAADLDVRDFSPIYVFVIILAVSVVYQLSELWNSSNLRRGFLTLMLALIVVNSVHTVSYAIRRHQNGSGYASREWAASKTINYVKASSESRETYSNGIDAIHFLTGTEARRIPAKIDPASGKTNPEFEREINSVRNELLQNRAVVVYLDKITWRWYLPSKDELENVYRLPVLVRLDDGVIYGIK